jgi:hypothetical protein
MLEEQLLLLIVFLHRVDQLCHPNECQYFFEQYRVLKISLNVRLLAIEVAIQIIKR